ncbi:diguanylate cyclase domain-containing protein [Marinobacterium weihaiense]|uniref:diguanylate cyclase n=1 Tax=Marinobacterium weihaiense TaxID=2851016 RepID=A0ABS6MBS3_9GAMM|nr:diguanylate cyclase [Marinobacterium weihaiense]MBV0933725.1 diguanylate cyclase [Marinobacterium weihaiense]
MKIRSKLLISLLLLLGFLGSGIWLVEHLLVIPKVESLEISGLKQELQSAKRAVQREIKHIEQFAVDWGHWDETHDYLNRNNPDFVRATLAEGTLGEMSMDFVLIARAGRPVLLRTTHRTIPLRKGLTDRLLSGSVSHALAQGGSGLVNINNMVLMVAASPVRRTDGSGPIAGMLYFGRMIDPGVTNTLEEAVTPDISLVLDALPTEPTQVLLPSDRESISRIWLPLLGDGSEALRVELHGGRPFLKQTLASTYQLMAIIFCVGLIGVFFTYLLLRHYLVKPVLELQQAVQQFSRSQTLSAFEAHPGKDELADLSRAFQDMALRLSADRADIINDRDRLKQDSLTDPLTELGNRRALELALRQPQRWRPDHCAMVMYVDLDHFKRINDTYGHDIGDRILHEFAQHLRSCCREDDLLIRTGGEEFLAICQLTDIEQAAEVAERIRRQTEQRPFVDGRIALTCSIGFMTVATNNLPAPGTSWTAVFKVADMALYRAKQEGRNRYVGWRHANCSRPGPLPLNMDELQQALAAEILMPVAP